MAAFPHFNERAHNNGSLSITYGFIGHRYFPPRFIPPAKNANSVRSLRGSGFASSNDQPFQATRHHREQKPKERRIKGSAAVGSGSMP
jgi:hypothetical protein